MTYIKAFSEKLKEISSSSLQVYSTTFTTDQQKTQTREKVETIKVPYLIEVNAKPLCKWNTT